MLNFIALKPPLVYIYIYIFARLVLAAVTRVESGSIGQARPLSQGNL